VLAERIGAPGLLLVATGFLVAAVGAAWAVTWFQSEQPRDGEPAGGTDGRAIDRAVIGGSAWEGFRSVARSPYLLGAAGYVLVLTIMATFIYFTRLQMVAALGDDVDMRAGVFARIDLATQTATLLLQLIVTGHIMKRLGVSVALALLPITAALGFVGLAMAGSFVVFVMFDATFRAVQRAVARPGRETLFTVVSREDKYKSKAFIDTFVYRTGDVVGAQTDGALGRLGMGLAGLAVVAVPLAVAWAALGVWLGVAQRRRAQPQAPAGDAALAGTARP
jgi:ATP:ADP antiporter, AAA family